MLFKTKVSMVLSQINLFHHKPISCILNLFSKSKLILWGILRNSKLARSVILGNRQRQFLDFDETFAPSLDFTILRLFLAFAADQDFEVHQVDVTTAFLNAPIDRELYVSLPRGYSEYLHAWKQGVEPDLSSLKNSKPAIFKLQKSQYGLKQAPRAWHLCLPRRVSFGTRGA
mmetsp:Transcript_2822/g.6758  ORF Transcript_2822/g.6758 Transcript_2822/m.6758 type:complete len:172 (+) Transcript_2822:930-1445(+)